MDATRRRHGTGGAGRRNSPAGNSLPFCALRIIYRAHIVTGQLRAEENGSSDIARWVPISEIDTLRYGTIIDEVASMMGYTNAAAWALEYREFLADENARKLS